jgi:CRISPR-associated protein Cas6/Cse3/CasE subtype I-E
MDYTITKPPSLDGYPVHRMVAGLVADAPSQHVDAGQTLTIRTDAPMPSGHIVGFSLRACVSVKNKGRHRYFPTSDWRSRHAWLARKGLQHGFEVITVHCTAKHFVVEKRPTTFTIDDTQFTGVLKVIDQEKFSAALRSGIGNTARAFGFGMLVI